jgi:hypothetical protein
MVRLGHFGEAYPPPLSKMNVPRFFAFQSVQKSAEFSLVETQLSCESEPKHDNRMPYAVEAAGGGRSSAISRRMSANRCPW